MLGQYYDAANAVETQKKASASPVKEQTVVFSVQQDCSCRQTCEAAN